MRKAERKDTKATIVKEKDLSFRQMSKHDVRNALTKKRIPFSNTVYGPYRMIPPEFLHTSGSRLIMYMFRKLKSMFGSVMGGMARREMLDKLHQQISGELQRQGERDFPRGSVRNRTIDGTKCQSTEQR